MTKTVNVINKRDRVFNGIGPNQITSIPEHDLQAYERMGFQKFTPRTKKTKNIEKKKQADRGNPKVNDAIVFLQQEDVRIPKGWKTSQILDKAKELGWKYDQESVDGQVSEVEQAKAFLSDQGVAVGGNWKTATILKKAKEAGWEPEVAQPDENAEDDLDALEDELSGQQ